MAETTFTKPTSEEEIELLAEKKALEAIANLMQIPEKRRLRIFRSRKADTLRKQVEILRELTKEAQRKITKKTQTQPNPIGGGLPFEMQARKALADILVGAIKDTKKRLAEKER